LYFLLRVSYLCATHLGVKTSFHNQQLLGNFGSLPLGCSSYSLIYHCCGLGNSVYKQIFGSVNVCTLLSYQLSVKTFFTSLFSADLRPCRGASNIYCHIEVAAAAASLVLDYNEKWLEGVCGSAGR